MLLMLWFAIDAENIYKLLCRLLTISQMHKTVKSTLITPLKRGCFITVLMPANFLAAKKEK